MATEVVAALNADLRAPGEPGGEATRPPDAEVPAATSLSCPAATLEPTPAATFEPAPAAIFEPAPAATLEPAPAATFEPVVAAVTAEVAQAAPSSPTAPLDPAVAALCTPVEGADPCGPDLDLAGDADYLNFFAQVEGVLPASFFNTLDGTPFDRASVDIAGQLEAIKPLLTRTRDIRLLIMQGRLQILNRDLAGFAASMTAAAYWLDAFWDQVHPRPEGGEVVPRLTAISALDTPTVIFPLQYAPLFDAPRLGAISYRRLMIANDEVKPRTARRGLPPAPSWRRSARPIPQRWRPCARMSRCSSRRVDRIRHAFAMRAVSAGLDNLPALVGRIQALIDPAAAAKAPGCHGSGPSGQAPGAANASAGPGPTSLAEASEALAAIADYYSRLEPSSPTLPLVRQAHQLIGKSFIEVMTILVPTQMEKAAFQIGSRTGF